jgi:ElaB/YqjD/DUF883 family membrane-anchored ribosome-binding protein
MTSATVETFDPARDVSISDRISDACRHATHLSHEVRLLKSLATDAAEDGVHAAKRAITSSVKRGVEGLEDLKDEAVHRVKRQPLKAVSIALGAGLVLGWAAGWIGRRPRHATTW